MKQGTNGNWIIGIVILTIMHGAAWADDATWNQTARGTTYEWAGRMNWLPNNTTIPNGAGQTAGITNDILGTQMILLMQNITLGALNIGDAVASEGNYGMTLKNKFGDSFVLTFDSGAAWKTAVINSGSSGTPKINLNAPMALNSDLLVNIGGADSSNCPALYFNAVTAMNDHTLTFAKGVSGQSQIYIEPAADFSGNGTIINNSQVSVEVMGSKAFGGKLIANRAVSGSNFGSFTMNGGGFTNAAEFVINGYLNKNNTPAGGSIHSGNGQAFNNNPGQRLTRRLITFNGGSLFASGQAAAGMNTTPWGRGEEWVRDDVDVLDFKSGYNYLFINKTTTTTGTVINVGTVLRSRGASLFFCGKAYTNNCNFHATNALSLLIGAGGAVGSTTMSIVPWMGVSLSGGALTPQGFATYEEAIGFRELTAGEYANSVTAGSNCNVSVVDVTLTNDTTVNALLVAGSGGGNMGSDKTLTITSGGIFFKGNNSLGVSGTSDARTINFGAAEGVITAYGTNTNTIGAKIIGKGGLTKASNGTLTLTGANSYSGTNHVGGGTLRVGDGTYASNLGSGNVEVHAGATLRISCANAVADTATVKLYNIGPDMYYGRMQLDPGINETVKYLYLGKVSVPSGSYGATGSGAANIRDNFFTGAGVLTVTGTARVGSHEAQ